MGLGGGGGGVVESMILRPCETIQGRQAVH